MENGQSLKTKFLIDGIEYDILENETRWVIGELSKTLYTQISIQSRQIEADKKKGLLDDYFKDGKVKISFEASGINNFGIPTGVLNYEEDKNIETFTHFLKEGMEYSLDFFGKIEYKEGWVIIDGTFKQPYGNESGFPVFASIKFDPQVLNWKEYIFNSLEETKGIDPNKITYLKLKDPTFKELPEEIFEFKNLEILQITNSSNYWEESYLPLINISERIAELTQLKDFTVMKAELSTIPESISKLKELERLTLRNCRLSSLPDSIFSMPKLKYLDFAQNQVHAISENINLPSLMSIHLGKNLLSTLPISLVQQPNLKSINASDNPFVELPNEYNFFKGLELTKEEKDRLLDTTYKGADGTGLIKWDDTDYFASKDPELIAPVEKIIEENKLSKDKKALLSLVKRTIGFKQTSQDDYSKIGNHRFGGRPDLPMEISYPIYHYSYEDKDYHYEFIAQINCEEIAHLQEYLPRTGTLFFFITSMQFIGSDELNNAEIIYVEDNKNLASGTRFEFSEEDFFDSLDNEYTPFKAEAFVTVSVPSFYANHVNTYLFEKDAKSLAGREDFLYNLYDIFEKPVLQLKEYDHAVNTYGFTQHESPELQTALNWKGKPQDWIILLLVKSIGDFQWGDAGDLFFVIHKSDLAKKDFSKVFLTIESS